MIIAQSSVNLTSQHLAEVQHKERSNLSIWSGQRPESVADERRGSGTVRAMQAQAAKVEISQAGQSLQPNKALLKLDEAAPEPPIGDLKIQLLKLLVERFTGREIDIQTPDELNPDAPPVEDVPSGPSSQGQASSQSVGWGLIYDFYASHYESEHTEFQAQGTVRTSDGREIDITLQLSMSREFFSETSVQLRAGDAVMKDPLVVNFNATAAQLTERNFSFDIDADGHQDQIAFVRQGGGLLALDRNSDGAINDGSELFGALSGNGFAELSAHDEDSNGWIDEADAIYNRLRIWTKDADGQDSLIALGQAGIGAIYLGSVDTPFLLKDAANDTLGQVRQTGVFLSEDGMAGTVQQVDLVV
ncbi:MAG: hypothetical protein ABW095_05310 [Candidatus Thiodiazotropha sp.]